MSWDTVKLGELTDLISSGSTPKGGSDNYMTEGPVMFIRSQNVQMNELSLGDVAYISKTIHHNMKRTWVKKGDVLLNITGASIGRVAAFELHDVEANVNQHVCIIRPRPNRLDTRYLSYFLSTPNFQHHINEMQHGGTRQALTFSQIADFDIPLPPLVEQQRIAAILDKADALRAKRRAALAKLDVLLQSTFLDMFGDPVTNPKGWKIKKLGELGKWQSGGTPSRSHPEYFEGTIPWLSSGELEQLYTYESQEYLTQEAVENSSTKLIKPGSLLLGMYDTAALKSTINQVACTCNQAIAFSRLNNQIANTLFIYYTIQIGKDHFRRLQRGVRQKNLNLSMVRNIEIPCPPLNLQDKFADFVETSLISSTRLENALKMHDNLFHCLQQRAFKGEL
ncbi:MAG: restriction endonuclease subunit S [Ardenticatenaceae bacterium]|nr:restriction endonuclease subunit S [Ardenticatenaceae bacterium]MCB9443374.1 restriction endonuclease subunit S [Ardenticatenaceae bacterium]